MLSSLFSTPCLLLWCLAGTKVWAVPAPNPDTATPARAAADPSSTACGDIVNSGEYLFTASDIYKCLVSVPFNAAIANGFIDYYNQTLQFQSTLAYLKNPPPGYKRPAVDLLAGLSKIKQSISTNAYANQYEFEAALQRLIYSAHDTHLDLTAGVLGVFSFGAPVGIVSASLDGVQLPKIYFTSDIIKTQVDHTWQPSPISKINGQSSVDYLQQYAADNAVGGLESHADFNQLVTSPALDIQGYFAIWGGAGTFYPGDTLTFELENSTTVGPTPWLGVYNSPGDTGPLETGGDFYNFFVLGFYPASYVPPSVEMEDEPTGDDSADPSTVTSIVPAATSTSSASPTPSAWHNIAYPSSADVAQPDLGLFGGGSLSGYFLNESSVAVLSIPSFYANPEAVDDFSATVAEFLSSSKAAGMKKVVIDLQQNSGGDTLLAWDTFKQFFPAVEPFGGSRLRAHAAANSMGSVMTEYFEELDEEYIDFYDLYTSEWVSSNRVNEATHRNFTSWAQFFGPHPANEDSFTSAQRYDLNDTLFSTLSVGNPEEVFDVYGFASRPAKLSQPYAAEDIIILSDGLCASTCAVFMEMMHHEAGVRTVVAGGVPVDGPMQAAGLTRGARAYGMDILDQNIDYAEALLEWKESPSPFFVPNRTEALDVLVWAGSVNLRDQVRKDQDIPLQFVYEPADCRIFYTQRTVFNYTALWQYAADAIWTNPSLCTKGSTGFSSANTTKIATPAASALPSEDSTPPPVNLGPIIMAMISSPEADQKPQLDSSISVRSSSQDGLPCANRKCGKGFFCLEKYIACDNGKAVYLPSCVPTCYVNQVSCSNNALCRPQRKADAQKLESEFTVVSGYCQPPRSYCATSTSNKVKSGRPAPPH